MVGLLKLECLYNSFGRRNLYKPSLLGQHLAVNGDFRPRGVAVVVHEQFVVNILSCFGIVAQMQRVIGRAARRYVAYLGPFQVVNGYLWNFDLHRGFHYGLRFVAGKVIGSLYFALVWSGSLPASCAEYRTPASVVINVNRERVVIAVLGKGVGERSRFLGRSLALFVCATARLRVKICLEAEAVYLHAGGNVYMGNSGSGFIVAVCINGVGCMCHGNRRTGIKRQVLL